MELIRTFTPDVWASALEDWAWIGLDGMAPLCASPFGDAFLQAADGIWWLDTLEGRLSRAFDSVDALRAAVATPEGQDEYLLAGLALAADAQGLVLGTEDVYQYRIPPVLGGATDLGNIDVMPFVVASSITAQIHEQVKDLPPGATISGFSVDGQMPADEPAKKRGRFGFRR